MSTISDIDWRQNKIVVNSAWIRWRSFEVDKKICNFWVRMLLRFFYYRFICIALNMTSEFFEYFLAFVELYLWVGLSDMFTNFRRTISGWSIQRAKFIRIWWSFVLNALIAFLNVASWISYISCRADFVTKLTLIQV